MALTDKEIAKEIRRARRTKAPAWLHESRGRGRGALSLKSTMSGANWYYRHTVDGRQQYVPIGPYGSAPGEVTLEAARDQCDRLAAERAAAPGGDLRLVRRAKEVESKAKARTLKAKVDAAENGTLRALLEAYADALEGRGKVESAKDVRRLVRLHVTEAFPAYADAPAQELTRRGAVEILRRLVEAGKGRTAGKLRSFMRAAYAMALRAESDAAAPSKMLKFDLDANPIADTAALPQFNRAANHSLTESELRALWKRLQETDTPSAAALRISILLGGQRFNQLLRARLTDFDPAAATLTIYDPKGRRAAPRAHTLPLPALALAQLKQRAELARAIEAEYLFPAANSGSMTTNTVSKYLQAVRADLVAAKQARDFKLTDLRRTCETLLASIGISKDTRAQVQSHGLGGIQARHYDRYEYIPEKTAALEAWAQWLTTEPSRNVVPIKGKRTRKVAA